MYGVPKERTRITEAADVFSLASICAGLIVASVFFIFPFVV